MCNATGHIPLPDLPLEGYIQSISVIDRNRPHLWSKVATGEMMEKTCAKVLRTSSICEANNVYEYDVYEYCDIGSHAVDRGGSRAKTKLSVCTDQCIQHLDFILICPL